ncbi:MAG: ASKHA domain-containing protein [Eubacteriales bacterium]
MIEIFFSLQNKTVRVPQNTTILEAARQAGVLIESPCDGVGTCGKCRVLVKNASEGSVRCEDGPHALGREDTEKGYVLACQARAFANLEVECKNTQSQNTTLKILSEGKSFSYPIKSNITKRFDGKQTLVLGGDKVIGEEAGDTSLSLYGCSIDIGTTTLVVALVNLLNGEEIASVSALNLQSLHAQDVLTRIKLASAPEGLANMYTGVTDEINRMIEEAAATVRIEPKHIYEVVYSGNTTMIHLACNVNPYSLGRYPYTPQIIGGNEIPAVMLHISSFGLVFLPPIISAYVGPDITSGVLASQLYQTKGTTLFIDIGTNGEMVIAKNGSLSATSTAAGPAFEGMNITYGMRAGNGALELFEIQEDGSVQTRIIGDVKPVGICGSGLLDIVGELVRVGVIGKNGKLVPPDKGNYPESLKDKMVSLEGKLCFQVAEGVYLTQKDIRQVQLAKGAVRAGVEALLKSLDIDAMDVDRVEIAGSFGYHLRANSLINLGLLPRAFEGKIDFVGNTSKTGGKAFLLNTDFRSEMKEVVQKIDSVELANREDFEKIFVAMLSF